MFGFVKKFLTKIYHHVTSPLMALFGRSTIDNATLDELEETLIAADVGMQTTRMMLDRLRVGWRAGDIASGTALRDALQKELLAIATASKCEKEASVFVLVGINGSGKTTFASKLANLLKGQGKRVLLVAGDTFRAAATEQLQQWAERLGVDIVVGKENQDPASVVFAACEKFKRENYDCLIIDTAGRLQTKVNLMRELEKIMHSVRRHVPTERVVTLLTIDAMLGQNSLDQARLFDESTQIDGVVLTKLDGTGKGGVVFSIMHQLKRPVMFISFGEQLEHLQVFEPQQFVDDLLSA